MKNIFLIILSTFLSAKHAMKKAAKGHNAYRPKKSRPSDKNRAPIVYELTSIAKPPEYTVEEEGTGGWGRAALFQRSSKVDRSTLASSPGSTRDKTK